MEEVDFADGFDSTQPLLLGLVPAPVGTIAAGVMLGYLALRSPLPHATGTILAILLSVGALAISAVRVEERGLLLWLVGAARFRRRAKAGLILIEGEASGADPSETWVGPSPTVASLPEQTTTKREMSVAPSDVRDGLARERELPVHRLAFFSLAGGSGVTTLAVEVAAILADGRGAALVDLNLLCPRTGLRLGVPLTTDWPEFVATGAAWQLSVLHPCGLRVVPGPAETDDGRLAEDSRLLLGLEVILEKLESECRTVVLDIRAGLGAVTRWALDAADIIAVVLTPTAGGLQDAYRSTEVLRRLGHARKLCYVVNRGTGASLFEEAMADLGGALVGCVPEDPELTRAEAEHRLISAGAGPTARSLRLLAARLVAPVQPEAAPALRVAPLLGAPPRRERAG